MNNDRRLDRMERLLGLIIRRGRTRLKDIDERIGMLIDAQIQNEDQLRRMNDESTAMREESRAIRQDLDQRSREVFELFRLTDEKIARLAEAQIASDVKLSALIERMGH